MIYKPENPKAFLGFKLSDWGPSSIRKTIMNNKGADKEKPTYFQKSTLLKNWLIKEANKLNNKTKHVKEAKYSIVLFLLFVVLERSMDLAFAN